MRRSRLLLFVSLFCLLFTGSAAAFQVAQAAQPWDTRYALPGTIEAENYRNGGSGKGYWDVTPGNSGGVYRNDGVDIETCSDGPAPCYNVGWTEPKEWLAYNVSVAKSGTYTLSVRVGSAWSNRTLHFEVDNVAVGGTITVPNTGAWQTYTNASSAPVTLTAGNHTLKLVSDTGGYTINSLTITQAGAPAPSAPTQPTPTATQPTPTATQPTPTATQATLTTPSPTPTTSTSTSGQKAFGLYFPVRGASDPAIPSTIDRYIAGAPKVSVIVFDIGVSQGLTGPPSSTVTAALAKAQSAGIKVLIYISTYYGSGNPKNGYPRDLNSMYRYVDQAYSWFQPDGIFLDEVQYDPGTGYYQSLYRYIKGKTGVRDNLVWMNAGGWTPSDWMMSATDVCLIFEGHTPGGTGYGDYTNNWSGTSGQSWSKSYPPSRIAASVQNVTTTTAVTNTVTLAQQRGIGWLYVTDTDDQTSPPGYGHIMPDPLWSTFLSALK